jgi:hypothetical protein
LSGAEPRAKQILDELIQRPTLGGRLLRRLGHRAWGRPRVAVSPRLFKLYDIPDPWDPGSKGKDWESRLGPVSLRLGKNRREPAPHLKPREPKKPKQQAHSPTRFKPRGIPQAKQVEKRPPPPKKPPPSKEFGGRQTPKLRGKLPVRPDLAGGLGTSPEEGPETPSKRKTPRLRASQGRTGPERPVRPTPSSDELAQRRPPRVETPSNPAPGKQRMRRTKSRSASRRSLAPKEVAVQPDPQAATPAPRKGPASMDLDDLFGIPVSKEDRPRLRPKKK